MNDITLETAKCSDAESMVRIHHAAVHQTAAGFYSETILDNWSGPLTQTRVDRIAAAVHACLDSGAKRVLALGVLHASSPELNEARIRVAEGGDLTHEASWGLQGPGLKTREDWLDEFSLDHFLFLWDHELSAGSAQWFDPGPDGGRHDSRLPSTPAHLGRWSFNSIGIVLTNGYFNCSIDEVPLRWTYLVS